MAVLGVAAATVPGALRAHGGRCRYRKRGRLRRPGKGCQRPTACSRAAPDRRGVPQAPRAGGQHRCRQSSSWDEKRPATEPTGRGVPSPMSSFTAPTMTIGGESVRAEGEFSVVDPATGDEFARVPDCTPAQLDAAFAAAAAAFPDWSADEERRRALMLDVAASVDAAAGELASLLARETGKPEPLATLDMRSTKVWAPYLAGLEIPRRTIHDEGHTRVESTHRPLGVVAAIVPWNFPIATAMVKVLHALRAGDTVVLKPSPFTPVATLRLGEVLSEVLPPGVVNVVSGGDDLGAQMCAHPTPRMVSFTGSIVSGKRVAVTAAQDLKHVTVELGGNDAAILLEDADFALTVPAVLTRAFFNVGQTCAVPKRVFVPSARYVEAVDAFAETARTLRLGTDAEADLGPLTTKQQYERVIELVDEAIAQGATAVVGGRAVDGPGFYFEPTIVAGAREGQRIVDEEQFGPALPILAYDTVEEAIARANDTMFGLCGSVWSTDLERAQSVAERLQCGVTYVNAHGVHLPSLPISPAKWSGLGTENGINGLLSYMQAQVVFTTRQPSGASLVS